MSGKPGFSAYIGAIGAGDAFGAQLKAAAARDGVTTYYDEIAGVPTGTCAVLIHSSERSLVANLSAAEKYTKEHFDSAAIQAVVKGAGIVYSAGFFLTHASAVMAAVCVLRASAHGGRVEETLASPPAPPPLQRRPQGGVGPGLRPQPLRALPLPVLRRAAPLRAPLRRLRLRQRVRGRRV